METHERLISSPKHSHKDNNRLTVMILKDIGKVRSFKLSGRGVLCVIIFLLIYMSLSVLIINKYFNLRYVHNEQTKKIKQLEKDLSESRLNLQRSEERVTLWEDFVDNLQQRLDQEEEGVLSQETASPPEPENNIREPEIPVETGSPKIVDIQDLVIQKQGSVIIVDFKLMNMQPNEKTLEGYTHIITESKYHNPSKLWSYPKEILKNGLPQNYKKGELFIIKRFKPINGRIDLGSSDDTPSIIRVLVYDHSGALILKKEFAVGNES